MMFCARPLGAALVVVASLFVVAPLDAADFYPIQTVNLTLPQGRSYSSVFTLIQGRGVGFAYEEPHDKILEGAVGEWITEPCGVDCSYVEDWGQPVLDLDLGQDRELIEISVWGNGQIFDSVREFSLRFATAAEGLDGYGTSITYQPVFETDGEDFVRESFALDESVTARYVEFTVLSNFYEEGIGDGDQVGLGEIAFQAAPGVVIPVPDPLDFYEIESIESSTMFTDYFPVENLIEGPGMGFSNVQPHQRTSGNVWVTEACGFPCDYLESFDPPVLWLDLGEDRELNEIDLWGYGSSNANGVQEFSLRFATDADGPNGYGNSIQYEPTFSGLPNDDLNRMAFSFDQTVTARYVELTALDNFFIAPGDGSGGTTPGGDRVGLGEIAFPMIPVASVPGDYNNNQQLDTGDLDLQASEGIANQDLTYDLNKDGKVDFEGDRMMWLHDLKGAYVGDANLDGEFNTTDFVDVFTAGKYETGQLALWSEGDWDGSRHFDTGDFVAAFTDGGYEKGSYPGIPQGVRAIPEPSSILLTVLGLTGLLGIRQKKRQEPFRQTA